MINLKKQIKLTIYSNNRLEKFSKSTIEKLTSNLQKYSTIKIKIKPIRQKDNSEVINVNLERVNTNKLTNRLSKLNCSGLLVINGKESLV